MTDRAEQSCCLCWIPRLFRADARSTGSCGAWETSSRSLTFWFAPPSSMSASLLELPRPRLERGVQEGSRQLLGAAADRGSHPDRHRRGALRGGLGPAVEDGDECEVTLLGTSLRPGDQRVFFLGWTEMYMSEGFREVWYTDESDAMWMLDGSLATPGAGNRASRSPRLSGTASCPVESIPTPGSAESPCRHWRR
jgi:hypothetical protein